MNSDIRYPNKTSNKGMFTLTSINDHILNGNWPNSFYDPNPPTVLSSNYYTEAGMGDNSFTTFFNYSTIIGVLS